MYLVSENERPNSTDTPILFFGVYVNKGRGESGIIRSAAFFFVADDFLLRSVRLWKMQSEWIRSKPPLLFKTIWKIMQISIGGFYASWLRKRESQKTELDNNSMT